MGDNYRDSNKMTVYMKVDSQAWKVAGTHEFCMLNQPQFVVHWYVDDLAQDFGYKSASNPQVHRVQMKVTDNTRPRIHGIKYHKGSTSTTTYATIASGSNGSVETTETVTLECGKDAAGADIDGYVEAGFNVNDNSDGHSCTATTPALKCSTDGEQPTLGGTCHISHNINQAPDQLDASYSVTYNYQDKAGNNAFTVTRPIAVTDRTEPQLDIHGDCTLENSAGANINAGGADDADHATTGLFDKNRIADLFDHRDNCIRSITTTVTIHTGGCTPATIEGVAKCGGTASGSKITGDFLAKYTWGGVEGANNRGTKQAGTQVFPEYEAGTYAIQYTTTDSRHTVTGCRQIENVDHTHPIIQILGSDVMTLEATHQGNYIDDGATCSDQVDGVISQNVEVSGDVVNLSKVGTYTITYNCKDSANNAAPAAQRTVVVAQTSCPKCTIHGATEIQHEASFPYSDAGASCSDVIDGDVTTLCFSASYTVQTTNEDGTIETHEAGVDKPAPAQSKPDGGWFDGGATWGGLGYCDEMEGTINTACKDFDQDACLATTTCKWNIYKECSTAAAGALDKKNLIDDTAASGTSSTHDGAQIGTYFITYRAKNTVGLYNDGPNCRGGAAEYVRTVKVMDTLRPVITLKYDSGSGSATVAQGELSPTTSTTSDLTLTDTLSDKLYPSVTDAPYQGKGHFADSYGGNHEDQMMAEESTSSVNGWVIGAIASAVAGLALLGYSTRRTAVATSVPV